MNIIYMAALLFVLPANSWSLSCAIDAIMSTANLILVQILPVL